MLGPMLRTAADKLRDPLLQKHRATCSQAKLARSVPVSALNNHECEWTRTRGSYALESRCEVLYPATPLVARHYIGTVTHDPLLIHKRSRAHRCRGNTSPCIAQRRVSRTIMRLLPTRRGIIQSVQRRLNTATNRQHKPRSCATTHPLRQCRHRRGTISAHQRTTPAISHSKAQTLLKRKQPCALGRRSNTLPRHSCSLSHIARRTRT